MSYNMEDTECGQEFAQNGIESGTVSLKHCEIPEEFTWKITCDSIHKIFITENCLIIDFKGRHTYKVYIPIPGYHLRPSGHLLTCHI